MLSTIAKRNGLESRIEIVSKSPEDVVDADFGDRRFDVVVSDMWFHTLNLPWDGLYYAYALKSLERFLRPDCVILPRHGELKAVCLSMRVRFHAFNSPGFTESRETFHFPS